MRVSPGGVDVACLRCLWILSCGRESTSALVRTRGGDTGEPCHTWKLLLEAPSLEHLSSQAPWMTLLPPSATSGLGHLVHQASIFASRATMKCGSPRAYMKKNRVTPSAKRAHWGAVAARCCVSYGRLACRLVFCFGVLVSSQNGGSHLGMGNI